MRFWSRISLYHRTLYLLDASCVKSSVGKTEFILGRASKRLRLP